MKIQILMFVCLVCGPLVAKATEPNTPRDSVVLGDESLSAGIPGTGPLTAKDIESWLANPKNHEPLDVKLPSHLQVGADAMFVPEDNPMTRAKIELGRQLFFDRRLSENSEVSCEDCHHPDDGYGRQTQFGVGVRKQTGNRNSPVAFNRIFSKDQFWDGRAASLEEQAVGPIANPIEMANKHEACVDFLKKNAGYNSQFKKVFGADPNIDNVGKAIAAFERILVTGMSPYDANEPLFRLQDNFADMLEDIEALEEDDPDMFADYTAAKKLADSNPMDESALRGRVLFFSAKSNCTACHLGVNFTDEKYHNLGVGMDAEKPDLGRFEVTKNEADKGAFKTPTVRNVAMNPPYMHDGSQKTLEEVVEWYAKGGHPNPTLSDKVKKLDLTEQDKKDLVAFMHALTGPLPKVQTERLPK